MKRSRRLRRLVPDPELVRRRAAGETLRALAADYGVAHTTLGRYFARPELARELKAASRLVRTERRRAAAGRAAERKLEREIPRKSKQQAALEREREQRAQQTAESSARRGQQSDFAAWLDRQDARQPLSRTELWSRADHKAARAAADGAGIQALLEATGLRTRANLLRLIDPTILEQALQNDSAAAATAQPARKRLRRLAPDPELIRRRAAGETLRALAIDYQIAHTTLSRYFRRRPVARQLQKARQLARAERRQANAQNGPPLELAD